MAIAGYYQVVKHSYVCNRESSSAKIKMIVPWVDAPQFCTNMIGGLVTINGITIYQVGEAHPFLPGLYCNNIDIDTFGNYDAANEDFLDAWATITYGILDQPESEDASQVAEISNTISGEEMTLPKNPFQVNGESLSGNDLAPILIVPKGCVKISYNNLPQIDLSQWVSYVGKVNQGTFKGYNDETLMFMGCEEKRKISSDGTATFTYDFNFECQYNGWNKIYRPGSGWVDMTPKRYTAIDMTGVLPV